MEEKLYGLIGNPLTHSFSQRYFTEKFKMEGHNNCSYRLFPMENLSNLIDFLTQHINLKGFNVTIPFKVQIIDYLDETDQVVEKVGAVNTVQVIRKGTEIYLKGYNTDVYGFSQSLQEWFTTLGVQIPSKALVLGSGGASKAVVYVFNSLNISSLVISRKGLKTYEDLSQEDMKEYHLIVNTTPLGMFPSVNETPTIPYQYLTTSHYLYDLIYNPSETTFMRKGREMGASVLNGERMLFLQADKAWKIMNNE